jgi:myo-inositol-1(or 4)-monophosphatase
VSVADLAVEREIRSAVLGRFPGDGLLGEEDGAVVGTSGYTWVVDPIDGTLPFLTGQPFWCVSIAVVGPAGLEAGVIEAPVLRERWTARRGGGAFLNGSRLLIDPTATLTSGNIGFGATQSTDPDECGRVVAALYRAGGVLFRVGSGALMLGYVAANRLPGYYDPVLSSWDCFAGILIVEEAGGTVIYGGSMTGPGPLVAGNGAVVSALERIVGSPGKGPA